ncbi:hypothetical protein BV898_03224 [Hypsibius exemplaris]|uniref:ZP domain-containing protein n=1 Tax=Hypsibius exemplaris TaxID=2072580 RepID=A0A1W0X5W3_HYPEX|nr:hypothetical protein BV898_03224 [Hypsibius exemplaris]
MKFLIVLALFSPAVLAVNQVTLASSPISLLYRAHAGLNRVQISASVSLECRHNGTENFQIIVTADDRFNRSELSHIEIVGCRNDTGSGTLSLICPYSVLTTIPAAANCNDSGKADCGAIHSGLLFVRQLIEVPGSQSKLYWPGSYNVTFQCRDSPQNPPPVILIPSSGSSGNVSQCIQWTHEGSTSRTTTGMKVTMEMSQGLHNFRLDSCEIKATNGLGLPVIVPFLQNGMIKNIPEVHASGVVIREGRQYELTLTDLALPVDQTLGGVIDCKVSYCRASDESDDSLPLCPSGALPRGIASRSQFNAFGAQPAPTPAVDLQLGTVTLVVHTAPNARSSGTVINCPSTTSSN